MQVTEPETTVVEEVPKIDEAKLVCLHILSDLRQEDNGLWLCYCGVIGTIAANVHRELTFYPQKLKYNRANIRREIKRTMKRLKTGRKFPKY